MPLNILTFSPYYIQSAFVDTKLYSHTEPSKMEMISYVMYTDESDECKINKVLLHVYRAEDGGLKREVTTLQRGLSADDLPPDVQERLAVMMLTEPGTVVEGVGWRVRGSITVKG